jgi:site-specific DNA recombinase
VPKAQTTTPKRIGIWIRRARLHAEAKGWNIVEVYRLDAVSGKTVKEHPEAKRMLADIADGHITGLIFSKLARLARNTKELLEFAELFRAHSADLVSLAESIDTSSPAGRLFYTMIAAMAQWEREEISERVAASVPVRAKMGKPLGGAASFGYQWKDGQLIPDPKEAPVRKLLHELYLEHQRKKTVARLLNERGYRTRAGTRFSDTTVDRLLQDTTAKGIRRANYTKSTEINGAWTKKPESEWVLLPVPAIVSDELWDACHTILMNHRKSLKRQTKKVVQLFAGLTRCHCGGKMYVPSNTPKYVCSTCRNKIPIDDLEAVFQEQLRSFFFSPDEIARHLEQSDHAIKEKSELLTVLTNERKKLQSEADKLYDLYQSNMIDKRGFAARHTPLADRLHQLDEEIPKGQAEIDVLKIAHLSQEEIVTEARDLYSRWEGLPKDEKRRIVEAITENITVGKEDIEIALYYAPSAPASQSHSALYNN